MINLFFISMFQSAVYSLRLTNYREFHPSGEASVWAKVADWLTPLWGVVILAQRSSMISSGKMYPTSQSPGQQGQDCAHFHPALEKKKKISFNFSIMPDRKTVNMYCKTIVHVRHRASRVTWRWEPATKASMSAAAGHHTQMTKSKHTNSCTAGCNACWI